MDHSKKGILVSLSRYFELHSEPCGSQDTSGGIVNKLWIGQPKREGLIPGTGESVFSLLHNIQTGCGAHPTFCALGAKGCFLGI